MTKESSMQTIHLTATECTPAVEFDFAAQRFSLRGESWPENAAAFYRPLQSALESWQPQASQLTEVNIDLSYFNSSSTKMLFGLFDQFNRLAQNGCEIALNWFYDAEDDVSEEFGEELSLDFTALTVTLHAEQRQ
ncbi:DUF1987 domain-containing protein [Pantoea stewartii]|uniref:Fe-S oxidoreductase n=1 Tax=Pantoea stewartii TaxID=66269 RepID=A0AB34VKU9_9GAMM|nr:DUF1987 domain-containing protein [Pantoea stewartii]KTS70786.1 Fe-S oxidoreductase [Pantoea stewartii]KTT00220.1 Fe-S oxidoreductase [Pantoea stewartii]KTT06526.1 Fe-S oxidoreductase [Pantoea stewartii]